MKELSGSMEDLLALEDLQLKDSKIESIFCVNEVNEQQVVLALQNIELENLNVMVCPFVGPENSFFLPNLTKMTIIGCEKLQIIFSDSILRCLPQLDELIIGDCEELKHIFQDDLENQNMSSSTTCFPKLKALSVKKCNKLKYVFPVSICNQLPELKILIITEAKELEEIFKSSQGDGIEIVRIPNLKLVATFGLPSLIETQEIQFQRAEYHFIKNCDKLSLTSTSTELKLKLLLSICHDIPDFKNTYYLDDQFRELVTEIEVEAASKEELTSPQIKVKQTQETDQEFVENVVGLGTPLVATLPTNSETSMNEQSVDSPREETDATVTPSQELINEQSTTQQQSLGESHATIKPSQGNNGSTSEKIAAATLTISETKNESPKQKAPMIEQLVDKKCPLEETDATTTSSQLNNELINEQSTIQQQSLGEPSQVNNGSTSEKIAAATLSTISKTNNESPIQLVSPKQKDTKISVEGGTASTNTKALALSTSKPEKSSHVMEISVEQRTTSTNSRGITSSGPIVTSEHNSSSQEYGNGQAPLQSFSISTNEPLAMEVGDHGGSQQTNQIKNLGDTSQTVEDSGSSLLVRRELEQLVSEKHLNYETLSLLTDFLVKHPSVLLKNTSLTNRLKGFAYTCLADLLKFLQTHSVLDILGSSHTEFVKLIQDVRAFSFNKDWLDGVEKRALLPDLQFSRDVMQKLLDSKKQVTKEVEEMRLKLHFFNQHVKDIKHQLTSSEAVLASIIQQEEQVLETTAALSVPLGY